MNIEETQTKLFAAVTELQLIESIFAGLEQSQMIIEPVCYPAAELQEKIADLRQISGESSANTPDTNQTKTNWLEELNLWHQSLVVRDQKFSAFDLRLFCSNAQPQFDNPIYAALAGFYRKLPPTVSVLSKFDYVITKYFSCPSDNNCRALRLESKKVVVELRLLNIEWIGKEIDSTPIKSQIHSSLIALSKLSAKAKTHHTLRSWIENEFFEYSRQVKRGLSETFFVPEVTAATIICNLIVGNHFTALYQGDSLILTHPSEAYTSDKKTQSLIPNPLDSSFQALFYSSFEENSAEAMEQKRLSNLYSLIADEELHAEALDSTSHPVILPENQNEAGLTAKLATNLKTADDVKTDVQNENQIAHNIKKTNSETTDVLEELSSQIPNRDLIRNYLQKSAHPQIRGLRFDEFLDVDENSKNKNLSKVLELIIRAEEIMRIVMKDEGSLASKSQDSVNDLLEEIQNANNLLRRLMSSTVSARGEDESPQKYFETILYATNMLVEAQLRLSSAVVRRQNREENLSVKNQTIEHSPTDYNKTNLDGIVYENPPQIKQVQPAIIGKPNNWLMIAGIAVVVLGIAWFAFYSNTAATPVISPNVQILDPRLMLGGSGLVKARVGNNTLFGFVANDWSTQAEQQKKDNLKLLLEEGTKYNYDKVLLINQNGDLVGNANKTEIKIP